MTDQDKPPLTRAERHQRTLAVNAMMGIGNAGCHDVEVVVSPEKFEQKYGEDSYVISVEANTGDITTTQGKSE